MKKSKCILILLIACFINVSFVKSQSAAYVPGELLVKFKKEINFFQKNNLQEQIQGHLIKNYPSANVEHWAIPPIVILPQTVLTSMEEVVAYYNEHPDVDYVEPNYVFSASVIANDPQINQLWALENTGQTGGLAGADIKAVEAWEIKKESPNIKIGIIDTGIDWKHPDLVNNIWQNLGEDKDGDGKVIVWNESLNEWTFDPDDEDGIDDDGNGYADDFIGWNFVNDTNDPFDNNSHGTHIAGTIAAEGNNSEGIAGVTWKAQLVALKFLSESGHGNSVGAVAALEYARMMGVHLTNNSWGGVGYSTSIYNAMQAANQAGQLVVTAAGNQGEDNDVLPQYPASYDLDNIIAVAATNAYDNLTGFSNYGATSVDIAAPGKDIRSTMPNNAYGLKSGTSMAAPQVTGALALMWEQTPYLSHLEIKNHLLNNIDYTPTLEGKCVSNGRLNLLKGLVHGLVDAEFSYVKEDLVVDFAAYHDHPDWQFFWTFGDMVTSQESTPTHTYAAAGTYTVCLTITAEEESFMECSNVTVQSDLESSTFRRIFGDESMDILYDIVPMADGHFLIGGHINSDILLVKINQQGDLIWSRRLEIQNTHENIDLQPTSDGGFIMSVNSRDNARKATLIKLDATAGVDWVKQYSYPAFCYSVHETSDGGFILAGGLSGPIGGTANLDVFLIKTNISGDLEWTKTYGTAAHETARAVVTAADGSIFVMSSSVAETSDYSTEDVLISKISATGYIEWHKLLGGNKRELIDTNNGLLLTPNNELLLTASTYSFNDPMGGDVFLAKMTTDGAVLWERTIGNVDTWESGHSLHTTADGGFLINAGRNTIKLDALFELEWMKYISNSANTRLFDMVQLPDNTFLGVGNEYFFNGNINDAFLIRTKEDGVTCEYMDATLSIQTVQSTATTPIFIEQSYVPDVIELSVQETILNQSESINCSTDACEATFDYPTNALCAGAIATFTNTTVDPLTLEWSINDSIVYRDNEFNYLFSEAGTYSITLNVTTETTTCYQTIELTVHDNVDFINLGDDLLLCEDSYTLSAGIENLNIYLWDFNGQPYAGGTSSIEVTQSGTYTLTAQDACGETKVEEINISFEDCPVWPGDIDNNGEVNNIDFLKLGTKVGKSGAARTNASTLWEGQSIADWGDNTPDGVDAKHADTNGNGMVEIVADAQAISYNYGKTHSNHNLPDTPMEENLSLLPIIDELTINAVETNINVSLELEASNQVNHDIYGIAFTIDYRGLGTAASLNIDDSILGNENTNLKLFFKDFPGNRLEGAIVRTDNNNINIGGTTAQSLGNFIIVEDHIIWDSISSLEVLSMELSNIQVINNTGDETTLNNATASAFASFSSESINLSIQATNTTCDAGGTATAMPLNGTAPYEYEWDNGETTATASDLSLGAHYVTITDADGAEGIASITIDGIAPIQATIALWETGMNSAYVTATGGNGNFSFLWSDGSESSSIDNLQSGDTYSVTVTDARGCQIIENFFYEEGGLAIEDVNLKATLRNEAIILNWATANKAAFIGFEIQRSENGIDFKKIAWQAALNQESYQLKDSDTNAGITYYYRLKIIENNQDWIYSNIATAELLLENSWTYQLFPNPVEANCQLIFDTQTIEDHQIYIRNAAGQLLQRQSYTTILGRNQMALNIKHLATGLYLCEWQSPQGTQIIKIVKL